MNINILNKGNLKFLIPIFFILCGIYIRLHFLFEVPSFWLDTCFLANNLDRNYIDLFKPLDNVQVAPPLFLVISKFLLNITDATNELIKKDFVLLCIPCLCSIISMPLFLYLTNKMFKNNNVNIVATFLLAFSPIAINYALEFKQYSCELMFALMLLIIFYTLDLKNTTIKKLSLISFVITISIWFSLSSFFIIASGFLILLYDIYKNKNIEVKKLATLFIPFLVSASIFYFAFYIPVHNTHYESMQNFWLNWEPAFITFDNFVELINQKEALYSHISKLGINIFLILATSVIIMFLNKNNKATAIILLPLILVLLASAMKIYPFSSRLILFLLPSLIILMTQVMTLLKEKTITTIALASLFIFYSINNVTNIDPNYIYHQFYTRELIEILTNKNPELKNVISDKHVYPYYIKTPALFSDYMSESKEIEVFDFLENAKQDTYWILVPTDHAGYNARLIDFFTDNPKYKIIEKTDSPTGWNTFLLKIEKL